jgi:hypothetical protein
MAETANLFALLGEDGGDGDDIQVLAAKPAVTAAPAPKAAAPTKAAPAKPAADAGENLCVLSVSLRTSRLGRPSRFS